MTYIDEFLQGKVAVDCQTEEEAVELLRWCRDEHDIKWNGGDALDENKTHWEDSKDQTVYICRAGLSTGLQFGPVDYHRRKRINIISYNELLGEQYLDDF